MFCGMVKGAGPGGGAVVVKLSRQKGAVQWCLGGSPEPWPRVVPRGCPVAEIEGVEDVDDAERRGVGDFDGAVGVNDV